MKGKTDSPAAKGAWRRLRRHWQAGTLSRRLRAGLRRFTVEERVRWFGADSEAQAAQALAARAAQAVRDGQTALVLGDGGSLEAILCRRLRRRGIAYRTTSLVEVGAIGENEAETFAIVLCALSDARRQTFAAMTLADHRWFRHLPFEHASGLDESLHVFRGLDEYAETGFVSPSLLDDPSPYALYRESLQHFEQKCGLRDYLDLYQLIKSVVANRVPGDIAEFGSYRGHSGWLIARTLEVLGSDKQVYLFDTFESFPTEHYGVDHFWSATHPVNYQEVLTRFANRANVTLVKGDFTETLGKSGVQRLALAYIDCDSYRATRFLLETVPANHAGAGTVMVCEDYGHPALLGNRAAVHQVCDDMRGWFRFFSQFSGFYIMIKTDSQ